MNSWLILALSPAIVCAVLATKHMSPLGAELLPSAPACVVDGKTYADKTGFVRGCAERCRCDNGTVDCVDNCPPAPPPTGSNCRQMYKFGSCCPEGWSCDDMVSKEQCDQKQSGLDTLSFLDHRLEVEENGSSDPQNGAQQQKPIHHCPLILLSDSRLLTSKRCFRNLAVQKTLHPNKASSSRRRRRGRRAAKIEMAGTGGAQPDVYTSSEASNGLAGISGSLVKATLPVNKPNVSSIPSILAEANQTGSSEQQQQVQVLAGNNTMISGGNSSVNETATANQNATVPETVEMTSSEEYEDSSEELLEKEPAAALSNNKTGLTNLTGSGVNRTSGNQSSSEHVAEPEQLGQNNNVTIVLPLIINNATSSSAELLPSISGEAKKPIASGNETKQVEKQAGKQARPDTAINIDQSLHDKNKPEQEKPAGSLENVELNGQKLSSAIEHRGLVLLELSEPFAHISEDLRPLNLPLSEAHCQQLTMDNCFATIGGAVQRPEIGGQFAINSGECREEMQQNKTHFFWISTEISNNDYIAPLPRGYGVTVRSGGADFLVGIVESSTAHHSDQDTWLDGADPNAQEKNNTKFCQLVLSICPYLEWFNGFVWLKSSPAADVTQNQ